MMSGARSPAYSQETITNSPAALGVKVVCGRGTQVPLIIHVCVPIGVCVPALEFVPSHDPYSSF